MIYSKGRIDMATIFPREEKAEMLFDKILANPEACKRLKRTFYDHGCVPKQYVRSFKKCFSDTV